MQASHCPSPETSGRFTFVNLTVMKVRLRRVDPALGRRGDSQKSLPAASTTAVVAVCGFLAKHGAAQADCRAVLSSSPLAMVDQYTQRFGPMREMRYRRNFSA